MKNYIFLTAEGYTFQPKSESGEPDVENLQVVDFSSGADSEKAFKNLVSENKYLSETAFDEIFSYELAKSCEE